jgi:hypothetical protein
VLVWGRPGAGAPVVARSGTTTGLASGIVESGAKSILKSYTPSSPVAFADRATQKDGQRLGERLHRGKGLAERSNS